MPDKQHWENIWQNRQADQVSWFQEHAELSLQFIRSTGVGLDAHIIDVGGGASVLVDDLLQAGYRKLSVLDLSGNALRTAQLRLGKAAQQVQWIEGDITQADLAPASIDVWHDRAVFHFLTTADDRRRYVEQVLHAVKPGGHVIIATFAEDGPLKCSGLDIMRYRPEELHREFGDSFQLLQSQKDVHRTPGGVEQAFNYCYCRR